MAVYQTLRLLKGKSDDGASDECEVRSYIDDAFKLAEVLDTCLASFNRMYMMKD